MREPSPRPKGLHSSLRVVFGYLLNFSPHEHREFYEVLTHIILLFKTTVSCTWINRSKTHLHNYSILLHATSGTKKQLFNTCNTLITIYKIILIMHLIKNAKHNYGIVFLSYPSCCKTMVNNLFVLLTKNHSCLYKCNNIG